MTALTWILAALALLIALLGLAVRRRDPWSVRLAGLAAVAVAWVASRDRESVIVEAVPGSMVAWTTGPADAEALSVLEARVAARPGAQFRAVALPAGWSSADAEVLAGVDFGDVPRECVLVWTAPFDVADSEVENARALAPVASLRPATLVEPGDVTVRALAPLRVGRPADLEVSVVEEVPDAATVTVTVLAPGANGAASAQGTTALARAEWTAGELATPASLRLEPTESGPHRVEITVECARGDVTSRLEASGVVTVLAPPRVAVVGGGETDWVQRVLEVQGYEPVRFAGPTADLSARLLDAGARRVDAVVATGPLSPTQQTALLEFVDGGGGLFVVGGRRGGALPAAGEPLHEHLPVEVLRRAKPDGDPSGAGGGAGAGAGEPGEDDPSVGPESAEPDGPQPEVPPSTEPPNATPPTEPQVSEVDPAKPDQPATGDTEGAVMPEAGTSEPVEVERRRVAMVLVVDTSGSMGDPVVGNQKRIDFARESAIDASRSLEQTDLFGVVAFSDVSRDILPLGPPPPLAEIREAVGKGLYPAGGTNVAPGLVRARKWIESADAAVRLVVILTDADRGGINVADLITANRHAYEMAAQGITVSVVHTAAPNGDIELARFDRLARSGKGRLIRTTDGTALPRIVVAEVQRVTGRGRGGDGAAESEGPGANEVDPGAESGAERPDEQRPNDPQPNDPTVEPETPDEPEDPSPEPDQPDADPDPDPGASEPAELTLEVRAVSSSRLLDPVPVDAFPNVGGIADVAGRDNAHTLLVASDRGLPLLAFSNHGLGRCGVWTSGLGDDWGAAWRADPAFPARFGQWLAHVMPPQAAAPAGHLAEHEALVPVAPTRGEAALLEAMATDGAVHAVADLAVPGDRSRTRREGRGRDDALWGLAAALFLALVEFFARRM